MPLGINIKSAETEAAIRELAAATGEGLTEAIRKAAEERLSRVRASRRQGTSRSLQERIRPLQELVATERKKKKDRRSAKELVDELYDEAGLPL
jgi:antitoxin VapB